MTTDDLLKYFENGAEAARAIGLHRNTFYTWERRGHISLAAQMKYEVLTKGKLKATLESYIRITSD